jgi:hypothetical protein
MHAPLGAGHLSSHRCGGRANFNVRKLATL